MAVKATLQNLYSSKVKTAEEALAVVKSGDTVYLHSMAATPQTLIKALVGRAPELRGVNIYCLIVDGEADFVKAEYQESFNTKTIFVAGNMRQAVQENRADYIPIFLSESPVLFRSGMVKVDVALMHVSEPDAHGYCSMGTSVDCSNAVADTAKYIIAQVNPNMPRTHGDAHIHISKINAIVEVQDALPELPVTPPNELELAIARHVAGLIPDYATLQMGIGGIPNAVLSLLGNHKGLGVHTEMFSDGVIDLVEKGIITGEAKRIGHEKMIATFVIGSKRLFDFMHDNMMIEMLDVAYTNDTSVIRQNDNVCAINSALEVDLTGQICADSIGTYQFSGVGGQMDYMRGAALSKGGKPIIAMPSATGKGQSRIVTTLNLGASVTTTRAHAHYIVTEYGVAYLYGKSLSERAKALIEIAHPDHRERLAKEASERGL